MLGLPWRLRNKCVLDRILSTERGEFDRDQLKKVKITVSIHKLAEIMPLSMNSKKSTFRYSVNSLAPITPYPQSKT